MITVYSDIYLSILHDDGEYFGMDGVVSEGRIWPATLTVCS